MAAEKWKKATSDISIDEVLDFLSFSSIGISLFVFLKNAREKLDGVRTSPEGVMWSLFDTFGSFLEITYKSKFQE